MVRLLSSRARMGRWSVSLVILATALFIACSSDADPTATIVPPTLEPTSAPESTTTTPGQETAMVNVGSGGSLGDILVDGDGRTLYTFDRDTEGVSNCAGPCLSAWPPLLTADQPATGAGVSASIGSITLADGTTRVTVNGFPAHRWQNDSAAGDTLGHGFNNFWWVLNPDGTPQRPAKVGLAEHSTLGEMLVDGSGLSLYVFDNDAPGVSNCAGPCLSAWPPLLTEYAPVALTGVTGTVGTITRSDGSMQVTVNGFPVYHWQNDAAPGDAQGQGFNNLWWVLDAAGGSIRN